MRLRLGFSGRHDGPVARLSRRRRRGFDRQLIANFRPPVPAMSASAHGVSFSEDKLAVDET